MQDISFVYGTERHRADDHHFRHHPPTVNIKVQSSKEGSGAVVSSTQLNYGDVDDVNGRQPIKVEFSRAGSVLAAAEMITESTIN